VVAMRQGRMVERIERNGGYDERRLHAAIGA
jgi:hypothetical protein